MTQEAVAGIVRRQREYFNSSATRSYEFRVAQLRKLKKGLQTHEKRLSTALAKDLAKPEFEAYTTEIGFVLHDLSRTIRKLKAWMKPRRVRTPIFLQPASSRILFTPLGVNLIMSPFNYPVGLTFSPLIAAIAAGNTAVVRTSRATPHCGLAIRELIEEIFDPAYVACVPGEAATGHDVLESRYDHIFFTGSPRAGTKVMEAAAGHLTPVTLELGGKSPCIVHQDARLDIAVKRIVYGKFMNAGQTCVAPDYVLVHESAQEAFLEKVQDRIISVYGSDASRSRDYGRIVNERHFQRIVNLIDPSKVVTGGESRAGDRYIAPTVMKNVTLEDRVMEEEIFGPVLPVMTYRTFDDIAEIAARMPQHPLACYLFSESRDVQQEFVSRLQFGGGCVNHCIQHLANPNLPFGGVGQSGIGHYHGFEGFKRFSHRKSLLKAGTWFDPPLIYPPYKGKLRWIRAILK